MTLDANTGLLILMGLDVVLAIVVAVVAIRLGRRLGHIRQQRPADQDELRTFTNPGRK